MDLRSLIKKHEGSRLHPYRDTTGHLTIGYGRNLDAKGISIDEQELMFANDINDVIAGLTRTFEWFRSLDSVRRDAITDMAFNLGIAGIGEFHQMIAALKASNWQTARDAIFNSRWATQVGVRAHDIATMILTGEYSK